MRRMSCLFALLLTLASASCTPMNRAGVSGAPSGRLTHMVIMWMYDPGDETARSEVLAAGQKLQSLPGVISVTAGSMVKSPDRPMVDSTFDLAFVMTFNDEAAMRAYLANPMHLDLKKNVLDRYVERYKVYDFVTQQ